MSKQELTTLLQETRAILHAADDLCGQIEKQIAACDANGFLLYDLGNNQYAIISDDYSICSIVVEGYPYHILNIQGVPHQVRLFDIRPLYSVNLSPLPASIPKSQVGTLFVDKDNNIATFCTIHTPDGKRKYILTCDENGYPREFTAVQNGKTIVAKFTPDLAITKTRSELSEIFAKLPQI